MALTIPSIRVYLIFRPRTRPRHPSRGVVLCGARVDFFHEHRPRQPAEEVSFMCVCVVVFSVFLLARQMTLVACTNNNQRPHVFLCLLVQTDRGCVHVFLFLSCFLCVCLANAILLLAGDGGGLQQRRSLRGDRFRRQDCPHHLPVRKQEGNKKNKKSHTTASVRISSVDQAVDRADTCSF